jgi:glutathione S-transferase
MRILYGAPGSVFVRKPRILLQEKGISFIAQPVNPMLEVSDEFKAISPLKKIPVFKDSNYVVADSSAICAYIDMKYPSPSFYPKDPETLGQVLWLEEYADTALFQAIAPCYYQTVLVPLYCHRQPDQNAINTVISQNLPPVADYLEKKVIGKQYLVSDQFTIADVAVTSTFLNMYLAGFPLSESKWPHLTTYLDRHFQRESFSSCVEDVKVELKKVNDMISLTSE